jgi:hypothetical protein
MRSYEEIKIEFISQINHTAYGCNSYGASEALMAVVMKHSVF